MTWYYRDEQVPVRLCMKNSTDVGATCTFLSWWPWPLDVIKPLVRPETHAPLYTQVSDLATPFPYSYGRHGGMFTCAHNYCEYMCELRIWTWVLSDFWKFASWRNIFLKLLCFCCWAPSLKWPKKVNTFLKIIFFCSEINYIIISTHKHTPPHTQSLSHGKHKCGFIYSD